MRLTTSRRSRAVLLALATSALLMAGACDRASEQDQGATVANQALDTTSAGEDALTDQDDDAPQGVVGNLYREPGAPPPDDEAVTNEPPRADTPPAPTYDLSQHLPPEPSDGQLAASALRKLAAQAERERAQRATSQQTTAPTTQQQATTTQRAGQTPQQPAPQTPEIARQIELGVGTTTLQPAPRQLKQGVPSDPGTRAVMGGLPGGPLPKGYDGEEATPTPLTLQP